MKIEITVSVKKETHYELGDMFYNPKGGYKFVLCSRTIRGRIPAQMWYGVRDTGGSITIEPDGFLKKCEYLGKSKGFETLFDVKEEE